MSQIGYYLAKIMCLAKHRDREVVNNYFRKQGMTIGTQCNIYSNISTSESYLIEIGNNVTISNDVQFVTHDNSIIKVFPEMTDIFGKIIIGDNCFIGARSILMYGIELKKNIIVASGSVVTKSFNESGIIIGGNPAKKIGEWDSFKCKIFDYTFNISGLNKDGKYKLLAGNPDKLVKR